MNYLKIILAGGLLLLNVSQQRIAAEDEVPMSKPPLPNGKLVRELAPPEAWELTVRSTVSVLEPAPDGKSQMKKTRERISKAVFTQTEKMQHARISDEKGVYEFWSDGLDVIYKDASDQAKLGGSFSADEEEELDEAEAEAESGYTGLSSISEEVFSGMAENKFPFFRWIKPKHYIGVEQLFERDCLVFNSGNTRAWVDLANRQPVQWIKGKQKVLFQKVQTPQQMQFPTDVAAILESRKQDRAVILAPPKRGG
ncbi:MAG: hypothetical protein AAF649_06840 [Verrucomicrobiota bacterium]